MSYALVDAEVTAIPDITLAPDQRGFALLLRRGGRPVHFSLHATDAARVTGAEVWALVGSTAGAELLAHAIRDELAPPAAPHRAGLTVAVCTHDRVELLALCLQSLVRARAGAPPDLEVDLLVVDNNPPDDATRRLVAATDGVRYATEPRPGLDFARNRAIAEARGEFLAFLDDDVVVDAGWFAGYCEAIDENPDTGAVTGLVLPAELETDAQVMFERRGGFRRGMHKLRYQGDRLPGNAVYPTGAGMFGAGCNMVVRRELLEAIGGFDEALDTGPPLPGGGDLDIFHRVLRSGHALVYEPGMLVFHRHRRDREALRRQYWSWGDGLMAYVAKTYDADPAQRAKLRALGLWWFGYAVRQTGKGIRGRRAGSTDLAVAELVGGVTGLFGSYGRSRRRTEEIVRRHA